MVEQETPAHTCRRLMLLLPLPPPQDHIHRKGPSSRMQAVAAVAAAVVEWPLRLRSVVHDLQRAPILRLPRRLLAVVASVLASRLVR
jgi:hypothetical protein